MVTGVFRGVVVIHALAFRRQPPRLVAAPLAASAIPIRMLGPLRKTAEKSSSALLSSRAGFFAANKRIDRAHARRQLSFSMA
jgi:hypothetical protein